MPYEPCGRPFINLALARKNGNPQPLCILDLIIDLMSSKVSTPWWNNGNDDISDYDSDIGDVECNDNDDVLL